jgi:rhamnosyltransferase
MKCAAVIVIYNPKVELLKRNIQSIITQVDKVYCFNNGSDNTSEIRPLIRTYPKATLIDHKENIGIASALNYVSKLAYEEGFEWLLTLDQDSVCPDEMINRFSQYVKMREVAIICPVFIDSRRPPKVLPTGEYSEVDFCITSGAFTNLGILWRLGGFDDYLFVGQVDDEYCYRVNLNHYKIIQVNSVHMQHELGDLTPSRWKKFYLWLGEKTHSEKVKALSYKRKVSPKRIYLSTRNLVYLSKKYRNYPCYKFSLKFARYNAMSNLLRGERKILILKAINKGFQDGNRKNVNAYRVISGNE